MINFTAARALVSVLSPLNGDKMVFATAFLRGWSAARSSRPCS
ncbi:hypothetical protein [Halomonas dongshanensis]